MKTENTSKQERKHEKYKLLEAIEDFRRYSRQYVANNIPNVHRDIRIHLNEESYKLAESAIFAAQTVGNIRRKYIVDMCTRISLLNLMIGEMRDLGVIDKKRLNALIGKLSHIKECVFGWRFNEEAKRQQKDL